MIDLCPRCRIQAPHRPGREHCPRCGGPLSVVDDVAHAMAATAHPAAPAPTRPAAPAPTRRAPVPTGRFYRGRNVRWVARRPPEAIPIRRGPSGSRGPRLIPRYVYIPTWGLRDEPVKPDPTHDRIETSRARLLFVLVVAGTALAASAVIHLVRYLLLAVNRTQPLPDPLIVVSDWLIIFGGVAAFLAYVWATLAFMRWVMDLRAGAYEDARLLDPRRPVWVGVLVGVPLVNLIGAPLVLGEVAARRVAHDPSLDAERVGRRVRRLWVAWVIVNVTAVLALIARAVAWGSDSVQTGANALAMVIISAAVSAAFAFWLTRRVPVLFDAVTAVPVPKRRWVAVG